MSHERSDRSSSDDGSRNATPGDPVHVLSVVGARPQFVKLAPISSALTGRGVRHTIVHTGQHYDERMSQSFFDDLDIPAPDIHLGIGSGSHGRQTGAMLAGLESVLEEARPDWVLVYGDTNSTIAAALAAVKLHLPIAHLEAGLRSANRRMPEEHNRVLTDHAADLLLAPTTTAMDHLEREGLGGRARLVGDVMTDVCHRVRDQVAHRPRPESISAVVGEQDYLLATLHRPDNTDAPDRLRALVESLAQSPIPVVLAAHPRLRARAAECDLDLAAGSVRVVDPLTYPDLVSGVLHSSGVLTDSGGLQKEALLLGSVCTTVRPETEWPETLEGGWNVLHDEPHGLLETALRVPPHTPSEPVFGDGHAADRVAATLIAELSR